MTVNFSSKKTQEELVVFARNANVFSTTVRGVTTTTDSIVAAGSQTVFTCTNNPVQNIRSVTDNGTAVRAYIDFTPSYSTSSTTITFGSAITDGHTIAINYDYKDPTSNNPERIFPDYPRTDITIDSMPRMSIDFTNVSTQAFSLNAESEISRILVSTTIFDKTIAAINTYEDLFRTAINGAKKSFNTFPYIHQSGMGPSLRLRSGDQRVLYRTQDYEVNFVVERV